MESVYAGFTSPASDGMEQALDLNELLVKHPIATFFVRVEGESMCEAEIHTGDILVVDRALQARSGSIVVAVMNGEFTVKRLFIEGERLRLVAESRTHPSIDISPESDFQVWGVVTYVIRRV